METLQIKNVEVEGFGNLGHVVMRELQDRIILEGVNGVGKTMIFTAIRAALEGKSSLPERPLSEWIKNGHESAVIKLDLSNGRQVRFTIRVMITADDFDLQIKEVAEDGRAKKISSGPMTFLKTVVNAISFRPQDWRRKSDQEQVEEVFNFYPGLKEKLIDNDRKLSDTEQGRSKLLAKARVLRVEIESTPFTPNLPDIEIDPADLMGELRMAQVHNSRLVDLKKNMADAVADIKRKEEIEVSIAREIERKEDMIRQIQAQLVQARSELGERVREKATILDTISKIKADIDTFVPESTDVIESQIANVKQTNEKIRQNLKLRELNQSLEETEHKARVEYQRATTLKEERRAIMATAEIPIDGLQIGDGCLLYPNSSMDLVRLSALSDGEYWRVACGLVAAFNPRVRIMIIDNIHDLDKRNFEALCEAAKKYDMQIWIHKTLWDESEAGAGFLIRDGQVVSEPKAA